MLHLPTLALFAASSSPIAHPHNASALFTYLRSPSFALPPAPLSSCALAITALPSPNFEGHGTTQSKLLGGFVVHVNGVPLTAGPGHSAPSSVQPVRVIDLLPLSLLRPPPSLNVLAIRSYLAASQDGVVDAAAVPRVQALLTCEGGDGSTALSLGTDASWRVWDATPYHAPSGDAVSKSNWYHVPNEDLYAPSRIDALGWEHIDFVPPPSWVPAVLQPPFPLTLVMDASPPPAFLSRTACSITSLDAATVVMDFGQTLNGGLNLTFADSAGSTEATSFTVQLGEELLPSGAVMIPSRSSCNYTAVITLAPGSPASALNTGLVAHEFVQFRFAQLTHAPPLAPGGARAWVVQAARGGSGSNAFEVPCARSTPSVPARDGGRALAHGAFASSSPSLDATFHLCAYTAVATSIELNVDSQTRQRDLCHIDALFTNAEQYAVFPSEDPSVARRTARNSFTNSSAIWASSAEFKMSSVLMAHLEALETGDASLALDAWSASDEAINSDAHPDDYLSAPFFSGARYYDASSQILTFPVDCGGEWGCDALIDWPTQTRDGYVVSPRDAIRNGLGALTLRALSDLATWTGALTAAARYAGMAANVSATLARDFLRRNGSEAFVVDGASGAAAQHAAIHSTIYAVVGGIVDDDATSAPLAAAITAYLRRRDTGGSSCMTARWLLEALYRLGVTTSDAADFALELMSRETYPSWGFMIAVGATTTLEAWAPGDKWNTDWAHPWCASPAFIIPRLLMGVAPLAQGWARFRAAPQLSTLTFATSSVPTPRGLVTANLTQTAPDVTLSLSVPEGATARVCLPPLHAAAGGAAGSAADMLLVDGVRVATALWGRFLCASDDVTGGVHAIVRRQSR